MHIDQNFTQNKNSSPNTARYIDVKSEKLVQILLGISTKNHTTEQKCVPNTAKYIDVKSAKLVQILLGISTKISQKSQF